MKRDLPAYVYRRGKRGYLYYVRPGICQRIHSQPGTAEFAAVYARLRKGNLAPPDKTIRKLIGRYMRSDRWAGLAHNTRRGYERHLRYLDAKMANVDPARLRRVHVVEMRDALSDKPTDANRKVGTLSALMEYARDIGWLDSNPCHGVSALKTTGRKREPWPVDMIEAFRAGAEGRALLLFEMLIGTGQRIGDVLAMQWGHVEDGGIRVRQGKTGTSLWIPFTARLQSMLDATPRRGLYIVTQDNGRPVSYQLAWKDITAVRRQIGAMRWDVHGLRHTAASELAALGMDDQHIMAITGHSSVGMVRLYSAEAAQRARAKVAQTARNGTGSERKPGNVIETHMTDAIKSTGYDEI